MLNNVTNHQLPLSLVALLTELATGKYTDAKSLQQLIKRFPKASSLLYSKSEILAGYRTLSADDISKKLPRDIERLLLLKPVRTQSGVAPVTVLTKPFPCPGKCIFCPNDIRMPKSYLADEPGAQRAERNWFDPYLQTYNRLTALHAIGHEVDKVELIILGGTWSFYPEPYQIWFISECFRALNEFGVSDGRAEVEAHYQQVQERLKQADAYTATVDPRENKEKLREREIMGEDVTATRHYNQVISELYVAPEQKLGISQYQTASWEVLEALQHSNEAAGHRCVGLVIETRPDCISEAEVIRIRRLGCTKAQIGFQSLQDSVLTANKRGHDVAATRRAVRLLRQAGFKIHAHWMANLYGSSVEKDIVDYSKMFSDTDFMPDELKIYPCSLIASAELMQHYKDGSWQPYTHDELLHVVTECIKQTPEYCRLTRVIRDIPSTDIVVGNKLTNFRQVAERSLAEAGEQSKDIRAREIRRELFDEQALKLQVYEYSTSVSTELFLQFVSTLHSGEKEQDRLVGFLRLSLPIKHSFIDELADSAVIREVHVYGVATRIGKRQRSAAQHQGVGMRLIEQAELLAAQRGFKQLAVISAVGTRNYYRKRGFSDGVLYQSKMLNELSRKK